MKIEFISNTMAMEKHGLTYSNSFDFLPTATIIDGARDKTGTEFFKLCISFSFTIFELSFLFKKTEIQEPKKIGFLTER